MSLGFSDCKPSVCVRACVCVCVRVSLCYRVCERLFVCASLRIRASASALRVTDCMFVNKSVATIRVRHQMSVTHEMNRGVKLNTRECPLG